MTTSVLWADCKEHYEQTLKIYIYVTAEFSVWGHFRCISLKRVGEEAAKKITQVPLSNDNIHQPQKPTIDREDQSIQYIKPAKCHCGLTNAEIFLAWQSF